MPRTLWKGNISFGLVNVPVRLATAVREKSVHFNMLSKDGNCRLRRKLVCPDTGEEYDFQDTARGYEIAPDQYVIVKDEELERLKPEAGRTIEIAAFIPLAEVDPIYFDRTYYLLPDEGGAKGYKLLLEAMTEGKSVALARFVMRERQHMAALRPMGEGGLALHTMHYADEIVAWKEMESELPQNVSVSKQEVAMAGQLIKSLSQEFDPSQYKDEYRQKLEEMLAKKAQGEEVKLAPSSAEDDVPPVYNLMEALKRSVEQGKRGKPAGEKKEAVKKKASPAKRKKAS